MSDLVAQAADYHRTDAGGKAGDAHKLSDSAGRISVPHQ